jgi:hypothetical protein
MHGDHIAHAERKEWLLTAVQVDAHFKDWSDHS